MLDHLVHLLEGVAEAPERKVVELPLLGGAERHQLIAEWNDTAARGARAACCTRSSRTGRGGRPQAPALVFGGRAADLRRARGAPEPLAAVLRGLGVGPEVRVGLCLERSVELFVGLLGSPARPAGPMCRSTRRTRRSGCASRWRTPGHRCC